MSSIPVGADHSVQPKNTFEELEELENRIKKLTKRIKELESRSTTKEISFEDFHKQNDNESIIPLPLQQQLTQKSQ